MKNIEGDVLTKIYSKFNFNYLDFSSYKLSDESSNENMNIHKHAVYIHSLMKESVLK